MMKKYLILLAVAFMAMAMPIRADKKHQVDFTVNADVESNYNTADLRSALFNKQDTSVFVVSHRGDWHGTAENSLHSIQKAIEKGCAGVEVDVRRTKDGVLVLMADETVDRMTGAHGRVSDMTLSQLQALRLKEYHGEPTPLQIPTLEQALLFCKGKILIAVGNYKTYEAEINRLVAQTGTQTEYFCLDKVPRKTAQTWKLGVEQGMKPHDSLFKTYGKLRAQGVTLFVTDAPKGFNSFLSLSHVMMSASVSKVYGDGQKVAYILVRYDQPIDGTSLTTKTYQVEGHEVADVFASSTEEPSGRASQGNQVIIMLKNSLYLDAADTARANAATPAPTKDEQQHAIPQIVAGSKPERKQNPYPTTVVFRQVRPVRAVSGKMLAEKLLLRNTMAKTLVVDDFAQLTFSDSLSGDTLRYNLFQPANQTAGRRYPLVIFLHDASCSGQEDTYTLRQGLGATVWAEPEEQAKHPCFVAAPQFDEVVVDDNYNQTQALEATARLIERLVATLPVDTARIYITGQSMGCMMTYALMSRHPQLFTAGLLVAGHWRAADLVPMSEKPLWLVSSAGKSKEGAEEAIQVWQQHGGKAATAEWPLVETDEQRSQATADLLAKGGNIHYAHLTSGSHFDTWRVAYSFSAVRDWLFRQSK